VSQPVQISALSISKYRKALNCRKSLDLCSPDRSSDQLDTFQPNNWTSKNQESFNDYEGEDEGEREGEGERERDFQCE
jgi:hypothetical protein